jgi:hypothetical protein
VTEMRVRVTVAAVALVAFAAAFGTIVWGS